MLTPEDKSASISEGNFKVTISQELGEGENSKPAILKFLTEAVTSFSLEQNEVYNEEGYYLEEDEEEDDDDDEEFLDSGVYAESSDPGFTLKLSYSLNFNVIRELRECIPLPDDTDLVVRIEYFTDAGEPIFNHEFRGFPVIPTNLQGKKTSTDPLVGVLDLSCETFSLFNLVRQ